MKILTGLVSIVFFYLIFTIVVRIRSRPKRKIKEIFHGHVYWDTDNVSKIYLRSNRTQKFSNIVPLVSIPKVPEIKPVVPVSIPKVPEIKPVVPVSIPKVPEIKPVVPVSIPKTPNIKNPSWRNCQRITCSKSKECDKPYKNRKSMNCCSDSLFLMLKDVISILENNNIDTTIIYGTLIGSLRSKDIISFTPDVDIALPGDIYNKMHIWSKYLNDAGYIVFKSNIYRVCKANKVPEPHNKAPWTREWYPYMDIYNLKQSGNKIWSTHLTYIRWPKSYVWPTKKCIIRDVEFPCPQQPELVLNSLKKWYGDWRVVQKRGTLIKKVPLGYPPRLDIVGKQVKKKEPGYLTMDHVSTSIKNEKYDGKVILWANKNDWSQQDLYKYDAVANIINTLKDVGIDSFLTGGSALGAYRNHGWFSWDKDADLVVMSTDYDKIEKVLNSIPMYFYESKTHKHDTSDISLNVGEFGYHVSIPGVGKHKTPYIDLWLFGKNNDETFICKGFHNGCKRWCKRYSKKTCIPISRNYFYPYNYIPYGPYLMPTIRKPYLNYTYGNEWYSNCSKKGKLCSSYYNSEVFVFYSKDKYGNDIATAKIGDKVVHKFIIKDGEYKLMKPDSLFESSCKDKRVENVIDIIRSAAVYNISIFPRNGFLLGIVRHGGFLPTEKVDMDLGMLYSDISRIRSHLQIPSLKYPDKMIRFEVENMYSSYEKSVWDGIHPKTNKYLPSHCSIFIGNKKLTTGSFFYSYNASSVFYPLYRIKNHNLKMSKMEQMEYRKHNDGLIDLKTGQRGKYGNGKLGNLFDVSAFKKTVQVPFYDTFINIPIGYKSILKSFYGDDWHIIKKRRKFDNTLEIIKSVLDPKNIC